jgi:4,4'-diaponeurosporenoate glycosyltransferase
LTAFVLVLAGAGWFTGWLLGLGRRMPAPPDTARPSVSVVVPARNEAGRLPGLLAALGPQSFELIVVDDGSSDGTAALARAAGACAVSVTPPPGWTGKAWACWSGARCAHGDILVFLDADVEVPATTVFALAGHAWGTGGLVSWMPRQRVERAYEQLSAIPLLVALMGAGTGPVGGGRWWRRPAAFGMAMAVPRAVYFAAGGHTSARDDIADDLALARAVDSVGAPVSSWCGGATGTVRMYGEGPAGLARGWTKNLAAGAGALPRLRLVAAVAWVAAVAQACVLIAASLLGLSPVALPVAGAVYGAFVIQAVFLARRIGAFGRGVIFALPLLVGAFCAMFVVSVFLTVSGRELDWRGRRVAVGARS